MGQIYEHPTRQLKLRISMVSEVYVARSPTWQLLLNAEFFINRIAVSLALTETGVGQLT